MYPPPCRCKAGSRRLYGIMRINSAWTLYTVCRRCYKVVEKPIYNPGVPLPCRLESRAAQQICYCCRRRRMSVDLMEEVAGGADGDERVSQVGPRVRRRLSAVDSSSRGIHDSIDPRGAAYIMYDKRFRRRVRPFILLTARGARCAGPSSSLPACAAARGSWPRLCLSRTRGHRLDVGAGERGSPGRRGERARCSR